MKINFKLVLLIFTVISFVVASGVTTWMILDKQKKVADLEKRIIDKQNAISNLEPTANMEEPSSEEILETIMQLPVADEQPRWILTMQEVLHNTGLTTHELKFGRSDRGQQPPNVNILSTSIVINGELEQIKDFIRTIYDLERVTHIVKWGLAKTDEGLLYFDVSLNTYYNESLKDPKLLGEPIDTYYFGPSQP